jgi:hypothetical protein
MVFDNAIEAGNKVISNVGKMEMWGLPRTQAATRLMQPALKGATSITVDTGLDWVADDRIALAATSYDSLASEDVIISAYDTVTGIATLKTPLQFYHWGQATSTASEYNGVDIRGEVMHLTRNILIQGEDVEDWGC